MEELKVKFLMGPAECNDKYIPTYSKLFLEKLSGALGINVTMAEMDEVAAQPLPIYFIASGGAERGFMANYEATKPPYVLLTVPAYNSFAAAMEIMGFLQDRDLEGEILLGEVDEIADRLKVLLRAAEAKERIRSARLGCFGEPGGLIASDVDFARLKEVSGITMELYDLDELVNEYETGGYEENDYTRLIKSKGYNEAEVDKALNVYGALQRLIRKYRLDAVTVKCFDLLDKIHTTGCLALAILNAEGIPAACEGDEKSLLSMYIMRVLTGESGFMFNPCYMYPSERKLAVAHCTLPIDMPDSFYLTTHFESGIGVAVSCDLEPQKMTIFKCNSDLSKYYVETATLCETMHKPDLCRSQMMLQLDGSVEYFKTKPISNHHIVCKGDHREIIEEFFKLF